VMRSRAAKFVIASYLPGAALPLADLLLSQRFKYATWVLMTLWIVFVLALLVAYYLTERGK